MPLRHSEKCSYLHGYVLHILGLLLVERFLYVAERSWKIGQLCCTVPGLYLPWTLLLKYLTLCHGLTLLVLSVLLFLSFAHFPSSLLHSSRNCPRAIATSCSSLLSSTVTLKTPFPELATSSPVPLVSQHRHFTPYQPCPAAPTSSK